MAYAYMLNCGQYVLTENGRPIGAPLDEVCLALDSVEGFLHKHGAPGSVQAWVTKHQDSLRRAGCDSMADAITSITGRFPLEELNRCLQNGSHAGVLYRRALAGELAPLPLDAPAPSATMSRSTRRARP